MPVADTSQSDVSVPGNYNGLLYLTITLLSLATVISVAVSFYLYKWRRILLSQPNTIVPEEWAKYLVGIGKDLEQFGTAVNRELESVSREAQMNTSKISSMTDTYMELQTSLDRKDNEIKRLRSGYDAEIFRRFISRFARIEQTVDEFLLDDAEQESLLMLRALFEDAFDECGVSKFEPAIGDDYRKSKNKVADNPKTRTTTNVEEEFLIAEVLEPGYQLQTGEEHMVIIPSKVIIYKLVIKD